MTHTVSPKRIRAKGSHINVAFERDETTMTPPPSPSVISERDGRLERQDCSKIKGTSADVKAWDVFRILPHPPDDAGRGLWVDVALQLLQLATYLLVFCLILASSLLCKGTFLLMTSVIGNITVGDHHNHQKEMIAGKYVWAAYLALCAPELFCFIRCLHRVVFRNVRRPSATQFFLSFTIETFLAGGVGTLVFYLLPDIDAVSGVMFMSGIFLIPALLALLSRKVSRFIVVMVAVDLFCIAGQSSGAWAWPVLVPSFTGYKWVPPMVAVLVSMTWWENYVSADAELSFIRKIANVADSLRQVRSKTYVIIAPWKCLIYLATVFIYLSLRHMNTSELLGENTGTPKPVHVTAQTLQVNGPEFVTQQQILGYPEELLAINGLSFQKSEFDARLNWNFAKSAGSDGKRTKRQDSKIDEESAFTTAPFDAHWVFLVSVLSGFFCYQCAKFACKVKMQRLAFSLPLLFSSPLLVVVLHTICYHRELNPTFWAGFMPEELFWTCPASPFSFASFIREPKSWFWIIWVVTHLWIVVHIWFPNAERLADTDSLFVLPWYSGVFIDQGLLCNRRRLDRDSEVELDYEDEPDDLTRCDSSSTTLNSISRGTKKISRNGTDNLTRIYACATMWHETREEMLYMLKSIFRMDQDQSARRYAQKHLLKFVDPDYYLFEAHMIFDDAFETNEYGETHVNQFVRQLVEVMDVASSAVHQTTMSVKPPKKYSTPYGGQLVWTLPGKNKLTVHLKDKTMIRVRKRWSQVMYMYYLLGHRLMEKIPDVKREEAVSEHTFLLTLDGDVDFQPDSVQRLVDLMKKNRKLGAACGRIHPRGSGPIVWYQKFEYAVGHWFQKAAEHMLGCVLCSPGCFSLFRASALMDDDVLRKYATIAEQATDYLQYDQGEDRWLCTLLLKRGYRVEYSAASDALTFAPETFSEFFNQRRRWMPSTMANVFDLLKDHSELKRANDSISGWYIFYQFAMLLSSVLGPGTIFLMVAGALVFAQIISAFFALLMMAVIVGTALQIRKEGITSPHAMFLMFMVGSYLMAAILHPLEFTCIIPGILYLLAVPCTYLLLSIYSICNLHVVSWGTREVASKPLEQNRKGKTISILERGSSPSGEIDGVYSVGCGNLCKMLCCINPSVTGESPEVVKLLAKLDDIDKRFDSFDKRSRCPGSPAQCEMDNVPLLEEVECEIHNNNLDHPCRHIQKDSATQSESWLNDHCLSSAEKDELDPDEERFWQDLRDKFLYPLTEEKRKAQIQQDLVSLRNQLSFGFLMLNGLFILVVFLLQRQKNCLNVEWPLGDKVNRTMVPCDSIDGKEVPVESRLLFEPIGFVLLFFFLSFLVIQIIAMLMHRFGTLSHILASTVLCCKRQHIDKLSEEELISTHFLEIAKEIQAAQVIENGSIGSEDVEHTGIDTREIVRRLRDSGRFAARTNLIRRQTDVDVNHIPRWSPNKDLPRSQTFVANDHEITIM